MQTSTTQDLGKTINEAQKLAEKWLCKNSICPGYLKPFLGNGEGYLKTGQYILAGISTNANNPAAHTEKQEFINQVKTIDFLRRCVNEFRYWAVDHIAENMHYGNKMWQAKQDATNCAEYINCAIELAYLLHDNNIFVISQTLAGED